MKFSKRFESDYAWYLSVSDVFNFDGKQFYYDKKGENIIQPIYSGLTAKECFYWYDSQGVIKPCREPIKLKILLKTKGSVNLHIKMYAQDRAKAYLPKIEFDKIIKELNLPDWFVNAVEKQKVKYLPEWAKMYCN